MHSGIESDPQWLPAERLGQFSVDAQLRPWLIGKGLFTLRMRRRAAHASLCAWSISGPGLLSAAHKAALRVDDNAGIVPGRRNVLRRQRLGICADVDSGLDAVRASVARRTRRFGAGRNLDELSGRRAQPLRVRVAAGRRSADGARVARARIKPAGLWARRSRIAAARRSVAGSRIVSARHGPHSRSRLIEGFSQYFGACLLVPLPRYGAELAQMNRRSAGDGMPIASAFIPGPPNELPKILGTLHDYIRLTRLDRPIGIWLLLWPTLWAVWIAGRGKPEPHRSSSSWPGRC